MNLGIAFFIKSILLGVGLAMDAFSVSLANDTGTHEKTKTNAINNAKNLFITFSPF